jgi:hypothetical protein
LLSWKTFVSGCPLSVPSAGVDSEWNVKKQASKSFNVGPVGILYMGYHATEIQLDGRRSQLLYVLKSGNLLASNDICSQKQKKTHHLGCSCNIHWPEEKKLKKKRSVPCLLKVVFHMVHHAPYIGKQGTIPGCQTHYHHWRNHLDLQKYC